jgi:hypothetical protein
LNVVDDIGRWLIACVSGHGSDREQMPSDRREERKRTKQCPVGHELSLFERAASLERFEILLGAPSRSVVVDDGGELGDGAYRLRGVERPLDRFDSIGWASVSVKIVAA